MDIVTLKMWFSLSY